MHFLQLLFRAYSAALLLVFCLQLRTNKAQENTRQVIMLNMEMPQKADPDELVCVKLTVGTELRECMVVESSLRSLTPMENSFYYKFTACLCKDNPRNFYWDFQINKTVTIIAETKIVEKNDICPNNEAVVPLGIKYFFTSGNIFVD